MRRPGGRGGGVGVVDRQNCCAVCTATILKWFKKFQQNPLNLCEGRLCCDKARSVSTKTGGSPYQCVHVITVLSDMLSFDDNVVSEY
jgi:hypothetical protein